MPPLIVNQQLQDVAYVRTDPSQRAIVRRSYDGAKQYRSQDSVSFREAHRVEEELPSRTEGGLRRRGFERRSPSEGEAMPHIQQEVTPDESIKVKKAEKKARQKERKAMEKQLEEEKKAKQKQQEEEERLKRERKAQKSRPLTGKEQENHMDRQA